MKKYYHLFFLSLLFLLPYSSKSEVISSDITYRCLGGNNYEFTLTLYADCAPGFTPSSSSYSLKYFSQTCGEDTNSILVTKVGTEIDVVKPCPTATTSCINPSSTTPGIKIYKYRGTKILSKQCTDWVIFWNEYYGISKANAIQNNTGIYVESKLNNLGALCNSSPSFEADPFTFACTTFEQTFNQGTTEKDGDALTFSLVAPKKLNSNGDLENITYNGALDHTKPLDLKDNLFSFDPNTGTIKLKANTVGQRSFTDILVQESRNGVVIGSVVRRIYFFAFDCPNEAPTLDGIDSTNTFTKSICQGTTLTFRAFGHDAQSLQRLTIATSSTTIPLVNRTPKLNNTASPYIDFTWTPLPSDTGTHTFSATINDNGCPFILQQTYQYTIIVHPSPKVDLGTDQVVQCGNTKTLKAVITKGTKPYTLLWSTGATTDSIAEGIGKYSVTVTDANSCKATDEVSLNGDITANFLADSLCATIGRSFKDLSTSTGGTVNQWSWDFGDGTTSTTQNPSHVYSTAGMYTVKLEVTDSRNCTATNSRIVEVCDIPFADFSFTDSCQFTKPLIINDLSKSTNCSIIRREFEMYKNNVLESKYTNLAAVVAMDTGIYIGKIIVYNKNGCKKDTAKTRRIYPKPNVYIGTSTGQKISSYFFKCNKPDSTFYAWPSGINYDPDSLSWIGRVNNTRKIVVNSAGVYQVMATDKLGCTYDTTINVTYPIAVSFTPSTYCHKGDTIFFKNGTTLANWGASYKWDFGDGTFAFADSAKHQYNSDSIYKVILQGTDSTTCTDTAVVNVNVTLPDKRFNITPNPVCYNTPVTLEGPQGQFIKSYFWNMGVNGVSNSGSFNLRFTNAGENPISLKVVYNNTCDTTYRDTLLVHPQILVQPTVKGLCVGDNSQFSFKQTSGDDLTSYIWRVDSIPNISDPTVVRFLDSLTGKNPDYLFLGRPDSVTGEKTYYKATLTVQDLNGCIAESKDTTFEFQYVIKPVLSTPGLGPRICLNQVVSYFVDNTVDKFGNYNNVRWDFGDGSAPQLTEGVFKINHKYSATNPKYIITATVYSNQCQNSTSKEIAIVEPPEAIFESTPVCSGTATPLDGSKSKANSVDKLSYYWDFNGDRIPDTTIFDNANMTHDFKTGGNHPMRLIVNNGLCTDTTELQNVYVKYTPKAGFTYTDTLNLRSNVINFTDASTAETPGGSLIDYKYYFGDGDSSLHEANTTHAYKASGTYVVTHSVTNNENCTGSRVETINLSTFMALPTAYRPNANDPNDYNGKYDLVYKNIKELHDFRIYNRWGQVIFDAKGDLKAFWDGTYQGVDQPVGVYVFYANGTTIFGDNIVLTGNVTLLR